MPRPPRAFTFLEVMVVMVIIGIVAAVIAPAMRGPIENTALRSAAREVASAAALARQRAITGNERVALRFDADGRTWRIAAAEKDGEDRRPRSRRRTPATHLEDHPRTFPRGVALARYITAGEEQPLDTRRRDPLELSFYPDGTTSGAAIELKNRRDKHFTIEIAEGTGRIRAYAGRWTSPDSRDSARTGDAPESRGLRTIARSESERVEAYKDVASRIFGQVRLQRELRNAQQQQHSGPAPDPDRGGPR